MAIKISMTLEGTEVIKTELQEIGKEGEKLNKTINNIGKGGVGVEKIAADLKNAGLSFDQTSDKATKMGSSLKLLSSALRLVGIDIGGVSSASKLLNTSLAGAGVAIVGGAVVALGKLGEEAARTRGQLDDAFGSEAKGKAAFEALQKSAQQFGTTVGGLAPGLQALQTALSNVDRTAKGFVALRAEDLPGGRAADVKTVTEAYDNFIKILRAGRVTQDEAQKSAEAFFKTLSDGGNLTSAALKNLPVGTLKLLQEALGAGGLTAKQFFAAVDQGAVPVDRLVAALAKFGPEAQKAFDSKAIRTMGDALGEILATLEQKLLRLTSLDFSQNVIAGLDGIKKGASDAADEVNDLADFLARLRQQAAERLIQPKIPTAEVPLPIPRPDDIEKTRKGFIDVSQSLERLGAAGIQTGTQIAQGQQTAQASLRQTAQEAKKTADELEAEALAALQGRGGEAQKGRLGQIPVFVPQLAGAGGEIDKAGKEAGKQWVAAVESGIKSEDIEFNINTLIDETQRTVLIKPQISTPDEELAKQQAQNFGTLFGREIQTGLESAPPPLFTNLITGLEQAGAAMAVKAQEIMQRLQQIFSQPISVGSFTGPLGTFTGGGFGEFLAGGGQVRGPGSTTSDSIVAFLSNREWVVNAKAVDFYGSNLFAALNSMRLPRNLLGAVPKFAEGGQATAATRSLTLVLDGKQFAMQGQKSVVDTLEQTAVLRSMTALGRAPSWVR